MPKQPKINKNKEEEKPITSTEPSISWWKSKWLLILLGAIVIATGLYLFFVRSNNSISDYSPPEEQTSLADQLADVEFDESVSQEDVASHFLSVASAYMADGEYEKALLQYQKAESAGKVNARLYSDMATIFESKGDTEKQDEYLNKYINFTLEEIKVLKDKLSISGSYVVIGQTYEKLGDSVSAKESYQKALDVANDIKATDEDTNTEVQEIKSYLEQRLSEL